MTTPNIFIKIYNAAFEMKDYVRLKVSTEYVEVCLRKGDVKGR